MGTGGGLRGLLASTVGHHSKVSAAGTRELKAVHPVGMSDDIEKGQRTSPSCAVDAVVLNPEILGVLLALEADLVGTYTVDDPSGKGSGTPVPIDHTIDTLEILFAGRSKVHHSTMLELGVRVRSLDHKLTMGSGASLFSVLGGTGGQNTHVAVALGAGQANDTSTDSGHVEQSQRAALAATSVQVTIDLNAHEFSWQSTCLKRHMCSDSVHTPAGEFAFTSTAIHGNGVAGRRKADIFARGLAGEENDFVVVEHG